jgi:hypothetical protein
MRLLIKVGVVNGCELGLELIELYVLLFFLSPANKNYDKAMWHELGLELIELYVLLFFLSPANKNYNKFI